MSKKRTISEYRQVKDSVYDHPNKVKDYYKNINFDPQYIVDLIIEYPNDQDLGKEIRKYFNRLKG
jgi:hypothetical protein